MKKLRRLNNKGFSHVEAFIVAVVIIVVGAVGFYVFNKVQDRSSRAEAEETMEVAELLPALGSDQQGELASKLSAEKAQESAGQVVPEGTNCSGTRGSSGHRVELLYVTK